MLTTWWEHWQFFSLDLVGVGAVESSSQREYSHLDVFNRLLSLAAMIHNEEKNLYSIFKKKVTLVQIITIKKTLI